MLINVLEIVQLDLVHIILMFGCKLCLPIDLIFGTNLADLKGNHITYFENLKKRMAWAYETANDIIQKEQERCK